MIIDQTDQVDRPVDRPTDHYLTEAEAVEVYGLSHEALRSRRRRGSIHATRTDSGEWVYAPPVDRPRSTRSATNQTDRTDREKESTDQTGHVDGAALALAAMEARIMSLEAQLAAKDTQIGELHRVMATMALNAPSEPHRAWWKFW